MTKVLGYVDTQMTMYPNNEIYVLGVEEYEKAALEVFISMYYEIHEDFEEISND